MLVRILIDGMVKTMNGLGLNKQIKAFFHGRLEVYVENKEYEEIEKSADILQKNASNKCNAEIQKAQNYYNGYQQGIEDLLKCIRRN